MSATVENPTSNTTAQFLVDVLTYQFEHKLQTPRNFLAAFQPDQLMADLARNPSVFAQVVHDTTGLNMAVARRRTPQEAGVLLGDALDEESITPETVLAAAPVIVLVELLDHRYLWKFITEARPWESTRVLPSYVPDQKFIRFILERAMKLGFIGKGHLVGDGMAESLQENLPDEILANLAKALFAKRARRENLSDEALFDVIGMDAYMEHAGLSQIWKKVVLPFIAVPNGFTHLASETEATARQDIFDVSAPPAARDNALLLEGNGAPKS